ncbi:unnamed protein product, partial [Laminaria digitata]
MATPAQFEAWQRVLEFELRVRHWHSQRYAVRCQACKHGGLQAQKKRKAEVMFFVRVSLIFIRMGVKQCRRCVEWYALSLRYPTRGGDKIANGRASHTHTRKTKREVHKTCFRGQQATHRHGEREGGKNV